jgi:hypothetical protein
MRIVCEREAFAGERDQVEIRFGDPHAPVLFRPDRAEGEHVVCTRVVVGWKRLAAARLGLPDRRKMRSRRAIEEASSAQEKSRLRAPPQSGFVNLDSSN